MKKLAIVIASLGFVAPAVACPGHEAENETKTTTAKKDADKASAAKPDKDAAAKKTTTSTDKSTKDAPKADKVSSK